jgi:hypothetical protein
MSHSDSSAVGTMLIKVGLGASKARAMFELMDCHRLTTDERLGLEIFFATHFQFGAKNWRDSAARDRSRTGDSARAVGFGITAYMEPTLETRREGSPHLAQTAHSL